jgi:hypothetical protein
MSAMYVFYCTINVWNATSGYITLKTTSVTHNNLFLVDTSYTIAPGATALVVSNAQYGGSSQYNISENAVLNFSWTRTTNNAAGWNCVANVYGSNEYTASGYNDPTTVSSNNGAAYHTTYTLKVYPPSS